MVSWKILTELRSLNNPGGGDELYIPGHLAKIVWLLLGDFCCACQQVAPGAPPGSTLFRIYRGSTHYRFSVRSLWRVWVGPHQEAFSKSLSTAQVYADQRIKVVFQACVKNSATKQNTNLLVFKDLSHKSKLRGPAHDSSHPCMRCSLQQHPRAIIGVDYGAMVTRRAGGTNTGRGNCCHEGTNPKLKMRCLHYIYTCSSIVLPQKSADIYPC
jgi:hypothetical protein